VTRATKTRRSAKRAAGPNAGRTFIILNPAAGQDDPVKLTRSIGGAFAARGISFDLEITTHPGHAADLAARSADQGYRAVCVVGGDGTLAEVATGLSGTGVPLGIIPRGTANQMAANLRIPKRLEAAVDVIVGGVTLPIDLGRIDGRAFALVAGAGFDAAVMASATRELKERWGFGAYIFAAVKEAMAAKPNRFCLSADGRTLEVDAVTVLVANVGELFSNFIGIRFPLTPRPRNSWQDGLLDVVVLAPRNVPDFAELLWRAAHNKFGGDERLIHFKTREVTIEADPPIAVQIDGDPAGNTPVTATAVAGALQVIVPPGKPARKPRPKGA
jgi:YegS/Rv2252/BmrU family lipid kinase